jgi:hypothetical protein
MRCLPEISVFVRTSVLPDFGGRRALDLSYWWLTSRSTKTPLPSALQA